jgi:hypothetical protein
VPEPDIVLEGISAVYDENTRRILRAVVRRDPGKPTVYDEDDICGGEMRGVRAWCEEGGASVVRV